ncbi:MAG: hypothetical protein A3D31_07820 [Candidatus Fluviicola riflensis]|nr:MAG: hypothetical protein CHH17_07190 [Candidatus Fluviicola riflensis]OGS79850.1 MAG: hypothetical protein A3D31_07820 [Candidatus Fluviicola riflensis]OGS82365.1 MAG: hypothetical protein A2724_16765 [Fluviicola sp. RIFCSPHIGHO2_01_FULL_43_53]OGS88029.1 MAG: hypothetical protein A3E30_14200 [Fluviicola sp. RIFCSPHIGHO2_12_FULL_43_24]
MKRVIVFIGITGVIGCSFSCGTQTDSKSEEGKKMEQKQEVSQEAKELLSRLNYWVANGGDPEHRPDSIKSTGESNAMVQNLKEQIAKMGYQIEWAGDEYVFVTK